MENQKQISKQGRITRSNSSSSASTDLACPVPANLPPPASNLAAIMEQLSNIARYVRDIKESQSRLSNDIAQCKSLLQQHSSIIGQHETSLRVCENNIADIQNSQAEVSRNLEAIGNRVTALELNVGSVSNSVNASPSNSNNLADNPLRNEEFLERFRRSHNIIIFGIPESSNTDATVSSILNHVDPIANNHRLSISRLGATPQANRARPVKGCFDTPAVARTVLIKKNQLRGNTTYDSIKITDDKTPAQLNELSNLRVELRRRTESGEPNLTIKYVRGYPRIVPTTEDPHSSKN
nr:unnamed protein product [Callosobruchus chinensis]